MKKILTLALIVLPSLVFSQINWDFNVEKKKNDSGWYVLKLHATLVDDWYMYSARPIEIDIYDNPYLRYRDTTYLINTHIVKMGTEYYYSREVTFIREFRKYHSPELMSTNRTPMRCSITYLLCDQAANCIEETKNILLIIDL